MEVCPPGGDYASVKDDPSKTDNSTATWTASPAGEQAQGEGERSQLAGCSDLSGRVTHVWSRIVCKHLLTLHCCPRSLDPQACLEAMTYHSLTPIPQSGKGRKPPRPPQVRAMEMNVPLPHSMCEVFIHAILYNLFRVFSPDCTLHTAITSVISVLERSRLMHDYATGIPVRLSLTYTFIS